jgi:hypothetical protein
MLQRSADRPRHRRNVGPSVVENIDTGGAVDQISQILRNFQIFGPRERGSAVVAAISRSRWGSLRDPGDRSYRARFRGSRGGGFQGQVRLSNSARLWRCRFGARPSHSPVRSGSRKSDVVAARAFPRPRPDGRAIPLNRPPFIRLGDGCGRGPRSGLDLHRPKSRRRSTHSAGVTLVLIFRNVKTFRPSDFARVTPDRLASPMRPEMAGGRTCRTPNRRIMQACRERGASR